MADQATKDEQERAGSGMPGGYDPTIYDPPKNPRRTARNMQSLDEEAEVKAKYSQEESMHVLGYQDSPGFGYQAFKAAKRMLRTFRVPRDRLRMVLVPIILAFGLWMTGGIAQAVSTLNGYTVRTTAVCTTGTAIGNTCNTPATGAFVTPWPDQNFTAACTFAGAITAHPIVQNVTKSTDAASGNGAFVVVVEATTAAASTAAELDCVVSHD